MSTAEIEALRNSMRAAQVPGGGSYVEAGQHVLDVDNCFVKQSAKEGAIKTTWICEFKVVASTNPSHEVGSTRSYVENPLNEGWLGRFKGFLAAAVGCDPTKLSPTDENTIGDIVVALRYPEFRTAQGWPDNFLKGRRVKCEGMPGLSKKGKPITNKKWEPVTA